MQVKTEAALKFSADAIPSKTTSTSLRADRARATHYCNPLHVAQVVCHRQKDGNAEFLVRWQKRKTSTIPPKSVVSWHTLEELSACLHLVQEYCSTFEAPDLSKVGNQPSLPAITSLKRKKPGDDSASRDFTAINKAFLQLPSPSSRSASISSLDDGANTLARAPADDSWLSISVYNGLLKRREGWITAYRPKRQVKVTQINAVNLPTHEMLDHAALHTAPLAAAIRLFRDKFMKKLQAVPNLFLENHHDTTTPSLNFRFISSYVLGTDVEPMDPDFQSRCTLPCKPNMGANRGCEYTHLCICLDQAAVDGERLRTKDLAMFARFKAGDSMDGEVVPRRFPYSISSNPATPPTLQAFYREQRYPIYECNLECSCGPRCKSRLVQKGRKVPLTIFKTDERGWGVKCEEDLIRGEFIDVYLGEVITNAEAERREDAAGSAQKASYLYSLDKFAGDDFGDVKPEDCYIVDGEHMGNVTRFMNHSCEPNCRQYTVSYQKHDKKIYDLAFFAYEDIPKGVELTFDYMDRDEQEEDDVAAQRAKAEADPENESKPKCGCGATKCRGYLWI
ncbi:hypothetical protein B0A48_02899 [Cryoendolithus antarcticus]|uniref:SET domain-containing protein n=1 Tax=Cryoendolithus antarcticus TaxID=1507870 RepID=A0A1V8TM04_9PEZI|nr:hypothetical protein B0A48_02899 [Cryoendolithus antarcticus]